MTKVHEQTLLEKLRSLPPERLAEVEDFVDFLAHRQADERLLAAIRLLRRQAAQNGSQRGRR